MKTKPLLDSPPQVLHEKFLSINTIEELGSLLEIDHKKLTVYIYKIDPKRRYTIFSIQKRSKGERKISVPFKSLKIVQRKLAQVLQAVYEYEYPVHGYVQDRSISTNAQAHARQKYVLNLDIKDFFPSINFGRVRGMFIHCYKLKPSVATVLAQICCFDNQLPQGAPTSPIISNMICSKMDKELIIFAEKHDCVYTRYADDLTFSSSEYYFPREVARRKKLDSSWQVKLGEDLRDIIEDNGFRIKKEKVRLQHVSERQVVTGLVVNKFPNVRRNYVRQIRAMLYVWGKFGLEAAEAEYYQKYNEIKRAPYKNQKPSFKNIVRGKIAFLGMVKGKEDEVYIRYWNQLVSLAPEFGKPILIHHEGKELIHPIIYTEGKTDPKHLSTALKYLKGLGLFLNLTIEFFEEETELGLGHDKLLKMCENLAKIHNPSARIFIFDNDVPGNVKNKITGKEGFKSWGNKVYSCLLPIPTHRINYSDSVCIELFYQDKDLKLEDGLGRRLFLNQEFNEKSGRHESLDLICSDRNKFSKQNQLQIVDSDVYDANNSNVALSKNDFANYVAKQTPFFDKVDFSEFAKIFELIEKIVDFSLH